MGKQAIQKVGKGAFEGAARSAMPWFDEAVRSIRRDISTSRDESRAMRREFHDEIRMLDSKVDTLRDEMRDRFDQMLSTVTKFSHRVTRLDGRIEGHMEAMRLSLNIDRGPKRRRVG